MRLVSIEAENFKRLRVVRIEPTGPVTPIVGRNGAGKTSALDAVAAALGGTALCPEMPIRAGESFAEVKVDLGDFTVSRFWRRGDDDVVRSNLQVRGRDGELFKSPQTILDGIFSGLSFDPLEFARQPPGAQAVTLAKIAGLDLEKTDGIVRGLFSERTEVNRLHKTAAAQLAGMSVEAGPLEEVSVSSLADKLQQVQERNSSRQRLRNEADRLGEAHATAKTRVDRLKKELAAAQADEERLKESLARAVGAVDAAGPLEDVTSIRSEMATAEGENAKVRQRKARAVKAKEVRDLKERADALTSRIEAQQRAKTDAISAAKLPISGLSLGDTGVLLEGIPLSQCSGAERIRVSVAIGFALNPRLRLILIRDGSLLDADGMRLLEELAEKADAQVLIERVAGAGETGVIIEDGSVKEMAVVA